jgi:GDP-fucose protein O-fucosyltransferase
MIMETILALAVTTGRTLVLPPEGEITMLNTAHDKVDTERKLFTYKDFFNMDAISAEHSGLNIISTTEFLERHVLTGEVTGKNGQRLWPPNYKTMWDGASTDEHDILYGWLENETRVIDWVPNACFLALPQSGSIEDVLEVLHAMGEMFAHDPKVEQFIGNPVDINATLVDRMSEMRAGRSRICLYDEELQKEKLLHASSRVVVERRLLIHYSAFLFFQNWKEDLWLKRFIRDHVRYTDDIQCAAARVVAAVRDRSRTRGYPDGVFDSAHVRRGDFLTMWYNVSTTSAENILKMFRKNIPLNATVYIATDERNKTYFDPLRDVYDVVFMDDFLDLLQGINTNFYGMIDQLVATRGRTFYGCWFSTMTVSAL